MKMLMTIIVVILLVSCSKKVDLPQVEVYGHAGTSLHKEKSVYPANSYESIEYAIDVLDADGVEIDIQMTKDSILVLYHDPFLNEGSNYSGCISQYDFVDLKGLKLENTNYKVVQLNEVLLFMQSRNKLVYLDVKDYDYCNEKHLSTSAFQYALDQSLLDVSENYKSKIVLGMLNLNFLNTINYPNKCYENSDVNLVVDHALTYNISSVLFRADLVTEAERSFLEQSGLNWGVFGIKDKWSIKSVIRLNPNFVITDNIAYTKQISN